MTAQAAAGQCKAGHHEIGGGCCPSAPPSSLRMVPVLAYCRCPAECITGDVCDWCGSVGPLWVPADQVTDAMTVLDKAGWVQ
jgi:hypothetical protein